MEQSRRRAKISTLGSRITSVISVALVLIILGLLAMSGAGSRRLADEVRSNMTFVVKMSADATEGDMSRIADVLEGRAGVAGYTIQTPEAILEEESRLLGHDIGAMLDGNPYGAEFEVRMQPDYANTDSVMPLVARLDSDEAVAEIAAETDVADSVNSVLGRLQAVLAAVAVALLIISFVLINNTVSLAVYSRRFIIHTMKLVGATGAFIRRPFVLAGAVTGLVAAVAAMCVLGALRAYGATYDAMVAEALPWTSMVIIFAGVTVVGVAICALASALATNRYLRADYDDMFMN